MCLQIFDARFEALRCQWWFVRKESRVLPLEATEQLALRHTPLRVRIDDARTVMERGRYLFEVITFVRF